VFWQGNKPDEQVDLNASGPFVLRLTAKGERKWEESMPVASRLAEEIFSVLTDEGLRTVALRKLDETLGRSPSDMLPAQA
jgi:hypothetical protein